MGRVVHFEIHAEQPERAIRFYGDVFGWTFHKWDGPMPYWLVSTGPKDRPGIDGGLVLRRGAGPADGAAVNAYVCTVEVESVDTTAARIAAAGGQVAVPKMPIPGIGWLMYFKDTEGNLLGTMQNDPKAA
jgi:hypothetical protein